MIDFDDDYDDDFLDAVEVRRNRKRRAPRVQTIEIQEDEK